MYINLPRLPYDLIFTSTNKASVNPSNTILQQTQPLINPITMLAILSIAAFALAALATPIPEDPSFLAVELGTPGSFAADPPGLNKSQVFIKDITYGGTGCPQGTVGKFISDDRHTLVTPDDLFNDYKTDNFSLLASPSSSTLWLPKLDLARLPPTPARIAKLISCSTTLQASHTPFSTPSSVDILISPPVTRECNQRLTTSLDVRVFLQNPQKYLTYEIMLTLFRINSGTTSYFQANIRWTGQRRLPYQQRR